MKVKYLFFAIAGYFFLSACEAGNDDGSSSGATEIMMLENKVETQVDTDEMTALEEVIRIPITVKEDMKSQLDFLSNYNYFEAEDFDVDSLSWKLSLRLTRFLKENELDAKSADSLGLEICIDEPNLRNIKLFNYGYHSGGTRGMISHPIIQWVSDAGKLCSYNFSEVINCYFGELHPLSSPNKELYLFLGQETGSGACIQNIVYCFEIRNDTLICNLPIFINRPYINLCNIVFEYDEYTGILTGVDEYEVGENINESVKEQGVYSESESDNRSLVELLDGLYFSKNKKIELIFNDEIVGFEKHY